MKIYTTKQSWKSWNLNLSKLVVPFSGKSKHATEEKKKSKHPIVSIDLFINT